MAEKHQQPMICYLIDMAYQETSETLQAELKSLSNYSQ